MQIINISSKNNTANIVINGEISQSKVDDTEILTGSFSYVTWYDFVFGDGNTLYTSSTSITHQYTSPGIYSPYVIITTIPPSTTTTSAFPNVSINVSPLIAFNGVPNVGSALDFYDANGAYYLANTIISATWNFGDGYTSAASNTTTIFPHTYYSIGNYTVSLSAFDVSGNSGITSQTISILSNNNCKEKDNYITLCGPEMLGRYGNPRNLNLTDYLPNYLKDSETQELVQFFQDFLNNMYNDIGGWQVSSTNIPVSANPSSVSVNSSYNINGTNYPTEADNVELLDLSWPSNASASNPTISILEKVNRLTELHDPDLIDIDYIQFFAKNLGYNISVYRNEVGISGTSNESFFGVETSGVCSQSDINKYLRFVVSNLPSFYKIKTTRNSIKVMLYSFGLVGDIVNYFTDSYSPMTLGGKWQADISSDLEDIPETYFPTPHFAIAINLEQSVDISFDSARLNSVIRAIESVRPANNVFRKLLGYFNTNIDLYVDMIVRNVRCVVIE